MSTAIATKTKAERDLEKLEHEINTEAFEAFYHIGQKLLDIKKNRRYESVGFRSWSAYCKSGRIKVEGDQIAKGEADRYIRASELRPKVGLTETQVSKRVMLELCRCETDTDAKRVARKAISLAKKTKQRVTAKLIAQVRDGVDETGAASKKQQKQLQSASLESHLTKLADILVAWRTSLEQIDLEQWESVPSEILTRVKNEADALSKYLRS